MVRTKSSVPTRDRDTASEILVLLFITVGLGLTLTGTLGFLFNFPAPPLQRRPPGWLTGSPLRYPV